MSDSTQVSLNSAYKIKNFITGETNPTYEIVLLESGAIRIRDIYAADGTDDLIEQTGIEEILFADGTLLLTSVQENSWGYTWQQWDEASGAHVNVEVRHGRLVGGIFGDIIRGSEKHETIEGGAGNDTLLGSAGVTQPAAYIDLAGGNNYGRAALSDGGVDTGITAALDGITNAQYIESASGEIRWVNTGSVSGNIQAFAVDAAGNSIDLSQQDWGSTYETLLAAVAQLQNSGQYRTASNSGVI